MSKLHLDFMVIGAAKSGTTTLHEILSKHPEIYVPKEKDFRFFDTDNFHKGIAWYEAYYKGCNDSKLKGDVSATYLYSIDALERIYEKFGNKLKLIVLVRDPVERAYSEYLHQFRENKLSEPLAYYLSNRKLDKYRTAEQPFDMIIGRSQYSSHLRKWLEKFSKENFLILELEEYKQNPKVFLDKLWGFLNVDNILIENVSKNQSYVPRIRYIAYMLQNEYFRTVAKLLVPSFKFREFIRIVIKKFNSSKSKVDSNRLSDEEKERIRKEFFMESSQELKNILI